MSLEETAVALANAKERRYGIGFVNMNALTLKDKEELAIDIAKLDREIVLLQRELDKEINK